MGLFKFLGLLTVLFQPLMQLSRQWVFQSPLRPGTSQFQPVMTLTSRYVVLGNLVEVIDRKTGKLRWYRKSDGSTDSASLIKGNLVACPPENVAIDDDGASLEGVDLATGSVIWAISKTEWPHNAGFAGMYSSVFAVAGWESKAALLYDVKSGRRLDPRNKADVLILKRSAKKYGVSLVVPNQGVVDFAVLNLLTGDITPIPRLKLWYQIRHLHQVSSAVAVTDGQVFCYVDLDYDGGAGHSQLPKYIASYDFHEKER